MQGTHRFSPRTGSPLSQDFEYPGPDGAPQRAAVDGTGELTNGEQVSSYEALVRRYRRRYAARHDHDPSDDHVWAVARWIRALKQEDPKDWALWFALAERVRAAGDDAGWMQSEAPVRDPATGPETESSRIPVPIPDVLCS
jgi:hypothetical protein